MKKFTLLVFSFMTIAMFSHAQILNGRFQIWSTAVSGTYTYDTLAWWKTTDLISLQNALPSSHSAQPEVADAHPGDTSIGDTSIVLTSWNFGGFVAGVPGAASNGDVSIVIPNVTPVGGVPDVVRHAMLNGYYKYEPVGTDSGTIETWLYKRNGANRDVVAHGIFTFGATLPVYTHFSVNIVPESTDTPDSSLIWMESSPRDVIGTNHGQTGSVLKVDSIYYSGIIGVDEMASQIKTFLTYPVPAVDFINVSVELNSPVKMNYEISDVTGKKVAFNKMNGNTASIDITYLPEGNYIISLWDDSHNKLCAHNFTIVR
jgi:hypothetical protein